jgi:hypothetical protein
MYVMLFGGKIHENNSVINCQVFQIIGAVTGYRADRAGLIIAVQKTVPYRRFETSEHFVC